jgi:hypothetical protein
MAPAVIITIGVLFLLDQSHNGYTSFHQTWPVILVVVGAVNLASALSSTEGHISNADQPLSPPPVPPAPLTGPGVPPASSSDPYSRQGQ